MSPVSAATPPQNPAATPELGNEKIVDGSPVSQGTPIMENDDTPKVSAEQMAAGFHMDKNGATPNPPAMDGKQEAKMNEQPSVANLQLKIDSLRPMDSPPPAGNTPPPQQHQLPQPQQMQMHPQQQQMMMQQQMHPMQNQPMMMPPQQMHPMQHQQMMMQQPMMMQPQMMQMHPMNTSTFRSFCTTYICDPLTSPAPISSICMESVPARVSAGNIGIHWSRLPREVTVGTPA